MSSRKRTRFSRDLQCVSFPDDVSGHGVQRERREPPSLSSVSSAKSWDKCGDSFLDSPAIKSLKSSGRKLSALRKLAQNPALVQSNAGHCSEDPVHIAWSSSDGDQSDDETKKRPHPQRPGRSVAPVQSYTRELCMLRGNEEELAAIDTDSDLDESEDDVEKDSGQQISDCESVSLEQQPPALLPKPPNETELEISGYVSDGESIRDSTTPSRLDSESFSLQTGEGSRRSVGDWVRSAQAILQTPQKRLDWQSKTPEDSAKKRRKFQSGGLAERLNRLQCRQRSAFSFWRHHSVSDTSTPTTVDRPGVLVLDVLEVQEECSMQLVYCAHQRPPGEGHHQNDPVSEERVHVLVLFNRETAAQLIPAARDVIHIYPPWQRLSTEGFDCDIILNTHFSQKVLSDRKPADVSVSRRLLSSERCMPYYLGKMFGLHELHGTTGDATAKVAAPDPLCRSEGSGEVSSHCLSLLEAVERLGQAGSVGQDVEVVVQRVFSIPLPEHSSVSSLKHRVPSRSSSAPRPAEKGKTRLCVLVQDGYDMFSVVQLHLLPCKDDIVEYCRRWQGKTCVLRGIKVLQRVTRERRTRLFSLIDSLWPPALPRDHQNSPESKESRPATLSFCYLLSGQESSVEPTERQTESLLYVPPTRQTLRDIVQGEMKTCRCSFIATVLHKRVQSSDVGQGEVWLVLTDPSLQEEQPERACRRTVALCVSTSCALTSSVLEALRSPAASRLAFRDAIKEHGVLLCAEQSVIEVCCDEPEGSLQSTTRRELLSPLLIEPEVQTLPQPVRLDPLSLETTPNSLCALTGVIVGVDENTAYSWAACNYCQSDKLEILPDRPQSFYCVSCKSVVEKPDTKIQLEVFLSSASASNCTLKVKLQKKTIMSVLNTAALEGNEFPGYDVENVLGKEVGPLAVYVRVVTKKPAPWIGLEEICL